MRNSAALWSADPHWAMFSIAIRPAKGLVMMIEPPRRPA
jgi:hypothetical protein